MFKHINVKIISFAELVSMEDNAKTVLIHSTVSALLGTQENNAAKKSTNAVQHLVKTVASVTTESVAMFANVRLVIRVPIVNLT